MILDNTAITTFMTCPANLRNIEPEPNTGCWLWTAAMSSNGYGSLNGISSHRFVWTQLVGPVPDGMDLDHKCRTRLCCNPEHLEVVTRRTNLRRGKGTKLSPAKVMHIRKLYDEGMSTRGISYVTGVSKSQVHLVTSRQAWEDVS